MTEQPAVKSYFFGKGYNDLNNVLSGAWANNHSTAKVFIDQMSLSWDIGIPYLKWFTIIACLFATVAMYVVGTAFYLALAAIHVLILFIIMSIVYTLFTVTWIADRLYVASNKVFAACPRCKEKYTLPIYLCPSCGVEHTKLTPGVYGILKRTCECGHKIPTTFFNGRRNLPAKCTKCQGLIGTKEAVPVCIPVIGGPSVGKTCFISGVMKELVETVAPGCNLTIDFYDSRNEVECMQMIQKYNQGILQTKTANLNPLAYNFFIKGKFLIPERLMYIYDIAGEAFNTSDALSTQKQYDYSHGIIFVIDPLSIPDIRDKYQHLGDFAKHGANVTDLNDTFDSFMINFKRISGLSANKLSKIPCAIVINKTDAFDLENKIGFKAAAAAFINPEKGKKYSDIEDAVSALARQFLMENGMSNFVKNTEMCFKKRKYFTCSSLGHLPNGNSFSPIRVFLPVRWIISNFDKKLWNRIKGYHKVQAEGLDYEMSS